MLFYLFGSLMILKNLKSTFLENQENVVFTASVV